MTTEQILEVTVERAVAKTVEPLRVEIESLRQMPDTKSDSVEISEVQAAEIQAMTPQTVSNWLKLGKIGALRGNNRVVTLGCVKRAKRDKL